MARCCLRATSSIIHCEPSANARPPIFDLIVTTGAARSCDANDLGRERSCSVWSRTVPRRCIDLPRRSPAGRSSIDRRSTLKREIPSPSRPESPDHHDLRGLSSRSTAKPRARMRGRLKPGQTRSSTIVGALSPMCSSEGNVFIKPWTSPNGLIVGFGHRQGATGALPEA